MENSKQKIIQMFKSFRIAEQEIRSLTHEAKILYVNEWNHVDRVELVDDENLLFTIGKYDYDAWRSGEDDFIEVTTLTMPIDEFIGMPKLFFTKKINDKIKADQEAEKIREAEMMRKAELAKLEYLRNQAEALAVKLGVKS